MNPPEEQLIRDYVNRVSVAARGRLSAEDRRALVARTRELIEQNTRGAGLVGPMGVARFLIGLGDPAALVARECERLATQPPDATSAPPAAAGPRRSRPSGERRPRPPRGAWIDRLRPSGGALSGIPLPRPAPPDRDAPESEATSTAGPGSAGPGSAVPGGGGPGGPAPRKVLAGDLVTGPVPTGDEAIPGPASESIPRPDPGPAVPEPAPEPAAESIPRPVPRPAAGPPVPEPAPEPAAEAPGPVPRPADIRPDPARLGWPWQGMSGPPADRAGANGHGPGPPGDRAPDADDAPGADRVPDSGSAPVIGRWAGGTPVAGDQAAAAPSPGSSNGRAAANGHAPAGGAADSDFTAGDFTGGAKEPVAGGPAADEPGEAPADRGPADRTAAEREAADRGAGGRWMRGSRQRVSNWAGWKPTHTVKPGPSRFRWTLRRPSLPRPFLSRPPTPASSAPGAPTSGPVTPGPSGAGPSAPGTVPRWSVLRPSLARRPVPRPSLPSGTLDAAGAAAWKAVRYAGGRARERPLEAVAVVLIGLGGAVYPPVWLLGTALALASRVWDIRDKWLGLAIPLFVVIVGMGADVSLSGKQPTLGGYFREAWIFGGHLCRIVAVLGAVYLAWRSQQPRRQQSAEPWKKQRRFN